MDGPLSIKSDRYIKIQLPKSLTVKQGNIESAVIVLISSTYLQLLCTQIPKAQKDSLQCLFALLGSLHVKAVRKMLVKSTPSWHNRINYTKMIVPL